MVPLEGLSLFTNANQDDGEKENENTTSALNEEIFMFMLKDRHKCY